jgi:nitrite reductase/ring-hydroxylating ferredoxin subunit
MLHVDDILENGSKGFVHNGKKYFAVKKANEIYVYANNCPHLDVPLEWTENQFLDTSNSMIQCANHGALFVIETGYCVSGPCTGRRLTKVPFNVIEGGLICLP